MTEYPEWVMKYKTKGVYVKKSKSGYFLYRGHSERLPDKKYPVFKCDEYLGTVTEKDGLIPSSPPVKPGITVLRYGFFCAAQACCRILQQSLRSQGADTGTIYSKALLSLEGDCSRTSYEGSWLSKVFSGVNMDGNSDDAATSLTGRTKKQIAFKMKQMYGEDLQTVVSMSKNVYAVHVNGKWVTSEIPAALQALADKYGTDFSIKEK